MIFETTYRNRQIQQAIAELSGRSFHFIKRLRIHGVGSQRFQIRSASPEIEKQICQQFNLKHCNIELRPKGVIVWFGSFARSFAWAIPYGHLDLVKNGIQLTIYGGDLFMNVADAHGGRIDGVFLNKLMEFKASQLLASYERQCPGKQSC